MMNSTRVRTLAVCILLLSACECEEGDAAVRYSVGGTVTGLSGSGLVLRSGGDELAIGEDGPLVFAAALADGQAYAVTVHAQPSAPSQTCTVEGGEGTVSGADVMDVGVVCVTDRFAVGGTVSGLSGSGLVLRNDGGDEVTVDEDGPFAFPTPLEDGSAYAVTVHAQPVDPSQFCEVAGAPARASSPGPTSRPSRWRAAHTSRSSSSRPRGPSSRPVTTWC